MLPVARSEVTGSTDWLDEVRAFDEAVESGSLRLLFIVGMARSGTTWLNELLAQHPDVGAIGETYIFNEYLRTTPAAMQRFKSDEAIGLRRILTDDDLARSLRPLVFRAFLRGEPDWRRKRIIVEKTPDQEQFAGLLLRVVPEAYILHIARDPRAVIASWRAGSRTWAPHWRQYRSILLANKWVRSIRARRTIADLTDRSRSLRYEDLHADGATVLQGLFAWLGTAATLEECRRYVEACRIDVMRAQRSEAPTLGRKMTDDGLRWGPDFVRHGKVAGWEADLSRREIARIEFVAGSAMAELGYAPPIRPATWLPSVALYHASDRLVDWANRIALRLRR